MKILASIVALLLVAVIAVAGYVLIMKNNPPKAQASSEAKPTIAAGDVTGPKSPYKIPQALERAIAQNQDTVAWLLVPNTDINNSVVQANDNDFYLRRNEQKNDEIYGCYFADYECAIGEREVLNPNTIIYGHSSPGDDPDGKRFSQLFRFTDEEFAKKTPYIYLSTTQERMTFEIFSVFYTDTQFDYIQVQIENEQMREITKKAQELSIYNYDIEVLPEDRILTLSTCTEKFGTDGNHRFVIMARLTEPQAQEREAAALTVK